MTAKQALAEYLREHYGICKLGGEGCSCLRTGWRGTKCPNWQPVKAKNYAELIEEAKCQFRKK